MPALNENRMVWAAMQFAGDPPTWEALARGLAVPRDKLDLKALEAIGEPAEGPDFTLTDELALKLEMFLPNGNTPHPPDPNARAHSWVPVDLVSLDLAPPEPPSIGGIVYPGRRHVFSGEPESLKTWAALVLCVDCLRAGGHVVYVDMENGHRAILERLRCLGVLDDEIGRFLYVNPDEPMTEPSVLGDVRAMLAFLKPALWVMDSFTGALALHGLDSNSAVEVEGFYRQVVDPITADGTAFLAIDHLPKDKDRRGKFSIGSERKIAAADVHLGFEVIAPFGRGKNGLAKVLTHKDRPGWLKRPKTAELVLESAEGSGSVTWNLKPGEDNDEPVFHPTKLMARVWNYVNMRADSHPSRHQIEEAVRGRREYVRSAIDLLVAEQYLEQREEMGAYLYSVRKVYEEPK